MAIIIVNRFKGDYAQALPIAREVAAILKRHGVTAAQMSLCHSGPHTGQIYALVTYPDWTTYGRAQQAFAADAEYQRLAAEIAKSFELLERTIIVAEDV
jgi:hypothetical protein